MEQMQKMVKLATLQKLKTGKPQAIVKMDSGDETMVCVVDLEYTRCDEFEAFFGEIMMEIQ